MNTEARQRLLKSLEHNQKLVGSFGSAKLEFQHLVGNCLADFRSSLATNPHDPILLGELNEALSLFNETLGMKVAFDTENRKFLLDEYTY